MSSVSFFRDGSSMSVFPWIGHRYHPIISHYHKEDCLWREYKQQVRYGRRKLFRMPSTVWILCSRKTVVISPYAIHTWFSSRAVHIIYIMDCVQKQHILFHNLIFYANENIYKNGPDALVSHHGFREAEPICPVGNLPSAESARHCGSYPEWGYLHPGKWLAFSILHQGQRPVDLCRMRCPVSRLWYRTLQGYPGRWYRGTCLGDDPR